MSTIALSSGHRDGFARAHLPPPELWPVMEFTLPELQYPPALNCAVELLDRTAAATPHRPAIIAPDQRCSYDELQTRVNRLANVLVDDYGLEPGQRVLLRAPNNPMLATCWFAVLKAGGVVVCTMPLLRARELSFVIDKARVNLALVDDRFADVLQQVPTRPPIIGFAELERSMRGASDAFEGAATSADDVALIAFTSGTTGTAKGTMHCHRDVLAVADTFSKHVLQPDADDLFCGSPPLAFTFGLGGLILFPMRAGAATLLLEQASPPLLLEGIRHFGATISFTAPTAYRAMTADAAAGGVGRLRKCVSAGETLPAATYEGWLRATGIRIIDGIGSTELLHIFISASGSEIRPGSTGRAVPGYRACVLDEQGEEAPRGTVGRLAVRGPTGCRYLDDVERQRAYVQHGWNVTGDAYVQDEDGYFWYQARTDDMIISGGYNIAGPEVENVLLEHPLVKECGVIGVPDLERGNVVLAVVVLHDATLATEATVLTLQEFVKSQLAPYKYPRRIRFVDTLPRTETGKLQRHRLREANA